ncbi:Endonuclease, Uma2 family (restriction endonuclease fold) [Saccharopolyspora shandongensis]|uniref:Endonuclease, Uma2 family (Restriction endonuclease fold) n=2 Tax=Saccharopolyspora shandongensis TaxID=418495 RepID=A0A1H3MGT8_9PSEU|nr:Endonuclease, Uma2 family (restriction endonuclease fold) [Saccharopolyspora shandongensis]
MSVVNMQAHEQHVPMTVDDLERLPDDGRRYELVDGRLDVSPAPVSIHSLVESRLCGYLNFVVAPDGYLAMQGAGINFNANRTHHSIPDVVVLNETDFEQPYLTRPPLLAIEVVSPESIIRDHHTKRREYAEFGIQAYWIVTPDDEKPGILEFRLEDGEYREVQQVIGEDIFATDFPFPVKLVPYWLLAKGPWRERIGGEGA